MAVQSMSDIKIIRRFPITSGCVQTPQCLEQNRNTAFVEDFINNGFVINKFPVSGQESVQIVEVSSVGWYLEDPLIIS